MDGWTGGRSADGRLRPWRPGTESLGTKQTFPLLIKLAQSRKLLDIMQLSVRLVSYIFSQQEFYKWKLNGWIVGDGAPTDAPPIAPSDPVSPNAGTAVDGGAGSNHQDRLNLILYYD